MGSLQILDAIKAKIEASKFMPKGFLFVEAKVKA